MEAARCANFADTRRLVEDFYPPWEKATTISDWRTQFLSTFPPRLQRYTRTLSLWPRSPRRQGQAYFQVVLERRVAAVRLAARLHQLDHAGRFAGAMGRSRPAYLPAVPGDPFAGENQPLKLMVRGEGVLVYSVGEDGLDGGGASVDTRGRSLPPGLPYRRYDAIDNLFYLTSLPAWSPETQ